MSFPLVSVLMCNYNYSKFIAESIKSVLSQTYTNFELIITDDGSNDNSKDIIQSFKDPRIITILQDNKGQAAAFNKGFKECKGEIISFLDSDDYWHPSKLFRVVEAFYQDDNICLVQHPLEWVDSNSASLHKAWPGGLKVGIHDLLKSYFTEQHTGFFSATSGVSCRRSDLKRIFPLDEHDWKICADVAITRPMPMFGKVCTLSQCLGYYRVHDANNWMNSEQQKDIKYNQLKYIKYTNIWLQKLGHTTRISLKNNKPILANNTNKNRSSFTDTFGPFENSRRASVEEASIILNIYKNKTIKSANKPVMIDAGALHGGTFNGFLSLGWKVHAFEPHPLFFQKLENKFESYVKESQLSLNKCALSDYPKEKASFYVSEESPGINSLTPFRESHEVLTQVSVTTLKKYFKENRIENIDFLKIDTEGYDLMVLKGFPWEQLHPKVILCEFENRKTEQLGYKFDDMAEYLYQKGYQVFVSEWYPIVRYGGDTHAWRQLISYPSDLADENAWGNILAFSPPIQPQILIDEFKNNIRFKSTSPPAGQNPNKYKLDKLLNFLEQAKQKGNKQEIIETLIVIVDKHPEHLSSAILLSNLFLESGDAEKAMTVIEYCSFYHPQSKALAKVRERIKNYRTAN